MDHDTRRTRLATASRPAWLVLLILSLALLAAAIAIALRAKNSVPSDSAATIAQPASDDLPDPGSPEPIAKTQPEDAVRLPPESDSVLAFDDVDPALIDPVVLQEFLDSRPTIERYRVVTVDSDWIREQIRNRSDFVVEVFPDTRFRVRAINAEERHDTVRTGYASFIGAIEDDRYSTAQLIIRPSGMVSGTFRYRGVGTFGLQPSTQPPYHFLVEADRNREVYD